MIDPRDLRQRALADRKRFKRFFGRLKRLRPKTLDSVTHQLHRDVFDEIDCLTCANCCKTTSPIFRDVDIARIAQHLGLRPAAFIEKYLQLDEEGDYVLRTAPCPFLGTDQYCQIYAVRPKACREYPHTDRKNIHQILDLTLQNTQICPAAFEVVRRLERVF